MSEIYPGALSVKTLGHG